MKTIHPQFEESQGSPNITRTVVYSYDKCIKCEGRGEFYRPDQHGDDGEWEFCECEAGRETMKQEALRLSAHND